MAKKKEEVKKIETKEITEAEKKRSALIEQLKPKLLSKSQLKKGGFQVRSKALSENSYQPILDEINDLGKELQLPQIGFSDIRR